MHKHVTKRAFGGYRRSLGSDHLDLVDDARGRRPMRKIAVQQMSRRSGVALKFSTGSHAPKVSSDLTICNQDHTQMILCKNGAADY